MSIPVRYILCIGCAIGGLGTFSHLSAEEPEGTQSVETPPAEVGLEQLAWLVGDWGEAGTESNISASCRWTKNHSFLNRSFSVSNQDEVVIEGTQIIGWNAVDQQIQSWTFDSAGGFGQGFWSRDGDRWTVKTHFVLAAGERASSLNVFKMVDENTFRWQSINRERGGELLPNVEEITIVRQLVGEKEK